MHVRLILLILTTVLVSLWGLFSYALHALAQDFETTLGQQQLASVRVHAANVEDSLIERLTALEGLTRRITPALMRNAGALQSALEAWSASAPLFSAGFIVTDVRGTAIASVGASANRVGVNYLDREPIRSALLQGRAGLGPPVIGRTLGVPLVALAVPVRDAEGQILGSMVGVIELARTGFLERVLEKSTVLGSHFMLIDLATRQIVSASERQWTLRALPTAQVSPAFASLLELSEGSARLIDPDGVEVLATVQRLPRVGWALVASLPTAVAFAPLRALNQRLLVATVLVSLVLLVVVTLVLRHQLAPLQRSFVRLSELAQNLPTSVDRLDLPQGRDEIGQLNQAFVTLLTRLLQREVLLREQEAKLKQTSAELQQAQALAHIGSWHLQIQRDILSWSDEIYRIFDVEPQSFGANLAAFFERVHPQDRTLVRETFERALAERTPYSVEHRLLLPSGRIKWVHERGLTQYDAQGRPLVSVGTVQDITERKLAELARQESLVLLRAVIDSIPMRVFWKDTDLRYIGCNQAFARDAGRDSADALLGLTDYDCAWAEQAEHYRADDLEVIRSGQPRLNYEEPQTTPEGQRVWLRTSKIPLRHADGRVFGVLGLYEDITLSRRYEDQLRKLSLIIEQSPEGIAITDLDGVIEYVNDAYQRRCGYARSALIGHNPRLLRSGETPPSVFESLWQTIKQGQVWTGELINRRQNGERFVVRSIIIPIRNIAGEVTHYASVEDDITEAQRLAQELEQHRNHLEALVAQRTHDLNQARAQADAANRAKSEFLANMSHEIRTPMNGVVGALDLLEQTPLQPAQRRLLAITHKSAMALLSLLNDILDFSKIEAGKFEVDSTPTRLAEVLEDTVLLMAHTATSHRVRLSLHVDTRLPDWVLADGARLRQVVINLLSNAIKFSRADSGRASVRAAPLQRDDGSQALVIEVRDNGIGMNDEVRAQLFTPFTQGEASSARRYGGTGLGLSIAQRLARLMGGDIAVDSAPGVGSAFTVTLPLIPCLAPADSPSLSPPDLQAVQVLCIDPDPDDWPAVQDYCARAGAQARWVNTEALDGECGEAAAGDGCRVLLIDLSHPDAAQRVRQTQGSMAVGPRGGQAPAWPVLCLRPRNDPIALSGLMQVSTEVPSGPVLRHELWSALAQLCQRVKPGLAWPPGTGAQASDATAQTAARLDAAASSRSAAQRQGTPRLLLVEDNETNRDVLLEQLRLLGYAADAACDGAQALQAWRGTGYDLVLTDCHMPIMDGFQLTAAIRQAEQGRRHTPIVAITANALAGEAQRCRAAGMDDYLAKPIRMVDLAATLSRWLGPGPAVAETTDAAGIALVSPRADAQIAIKKEVLIADRESAGGENVYFRPDALVEALGPDPALHQRLIQRFLAALGPYEQALRQAADAGDASGLQRTAHTLKSAARTVGAEALSAQCERLESACDASPLSAEAMRLLQAVLQVLEATRQHIADPNAAAPPS
ncbi:MAG: hypothetical protein OHK0048_20610 [Rhodoferax sp.]